MLPSYYKHVRWHKNSLITRFYGVHSVKPNHYRHVLNFRTCFMAVSLCMKKKMMVSVSYFMFQTSTNVFYDGTSYMPVDWKQKLGQSILDLPFTSDQTAKTEPQCQQNRLAQPNSVSVSFIQRELKTHNGLVKSGPVNPWQKKSSYTRTHLVTSLHRSLWTIPFLPFTSPLSSLLTWCRRHHGWQLEVRSRWT